MTHPTVQAVAEAIYDAGKRQRSYWNHKEKRMGIKFVPTISTPTSDKCAKAAIRALLKELRGLNSKELFDEINVLEKSL